MRQAKAILIARMTKDGLVELWDHVKLGQVYNVDLDTIREAELYNVRKGVIHKKVIINSADDDNPGWMPLEMIRLEGVQKQ